ncbi:unnamed protein product [Phytomonas sp. Hart1]|nr:unnamed protein product [Phytomonas sp. Hart1]|eukprot:CCW67720.1 unnamed protein product [Phytomonas sp. isolate Hart1]
MGSPGEQSTWVTHARAYREMGLHRRAHHTLVEGCARTGGQGPLIWEERLRELADRGDPAARRRVLEEATEAVPDAEGLWLELLTYQPPHELLGWVQRAVIACPRGEGLWLRLVALLPDAQDQRKILQRALQRSPNLPLLWAKFVRLGGYSEGLEIFRAAAQRYASLELLIEASKFVEWSAIEKRVEAGVSLDPADDAATVEGVSGFSLVIQRELDKLVRVAAQHYLNISEELSCRQWLDKATELCGGAASDNSGLAKDPSTGFSYLWTAAYMFLYAVLPAKDVELAVSHQGSSSSSVGTYLLDVMALLDSLWEKHEQLCALWASWLLLQPNGEAMHGAGASLPPLPNECEAIGKEKSSDQTNNTRSALSNLPEAMSVIRAAIETAPREVLDTVSDLFMSSHPQKRSLSPDRDQHVVSMPANEESEAPSRADHSAEGIPLQRRASNELKARVCLIAVLLPTLSNPYLLTHVELMRTIVDAFYMRGYYSVVLQILKSASMRAQDGVGPNAWIVCARAKAYAALGRHDEADACLSRATSASPPAPCEAATRPQAEDPRADLVWVKLAVHRRSRGQAITPLLEEGIRRLPWAPRLWLMRLEEMRGVILADRAATADGLIPPDHIAQMRRLYTRALAHEHCAGEVAVWVYAAVRIESELFSSAATARALLLDAEVRIEGGGGGGPGASSSRVRRGGVPAPASSFSSFSSHSRATLGMARAWVERRHGGDAVALEVVKETLQGLPKTSEGAFTIPVGELLQWFIDLEPPSSRGRAAGWVMRHWRSREALVLIAVGRLYHHAGDHPKAICQALKAVEAGGGRCGDAIAFLWRLALDEKYRDWVGQRLEGAEWKAGKELSPERIQRWVWGVAAAAVSDTARHQQKTFLPVKKSPECLNRIHDDQDLPVLKPNSGPLWISIAKANDPSNVTLTGYRDSVESMLRMVMHRVLP